MAPKAKKSKLMKKARQAQLKRKRRGHTSLPASRSEAPVTFELSNMEEIINEGVLGDNIGNNSVKERKGKESSAFENLDLPKTSMSANNLFSFTETSLEDLRQLNEKFINERNWQQFHSPRNVLLALVGEVGELAEIFQWKGEVSEGLPELSAAEREHVGQEISDVLLYLIDFASRCRIDLPKAVFTKMQANAKKYPVEKAYGQANKYTDYQ